jgi:hypothetical protein
MRGGETRFKALGPNATVTMPDGNVRIQMESRVLGTVHCYVDPDDYKRIKE